MWKMYVHFIIIRPHQWRRGSALKAGKRVVTGSIPGHACRPSHSKFSVVFSETRVITGKDPLERPPWRTFLYKPWSHKRTICLNPPTLPKPIAICFCNFTLNFTSFFKTLIVSSFCKTVLLFLSLMTNSILICAMDYRILI